MSELDIRDPSAPKSPAIPRFHVKAVKLEFASSQAGRPIYEDREFVDIIIPGDRRALAHEPVGEEHKARWPREYEAFRAGRSAPLEGTPLSEWPSARMSRSRVEELAYFNIRTVEELAGVNDAQLQNLGMGARPEREAARAFLEVARTGTGPLEKMLARIEDQGREIERLTRDLVAANARLAELEKEKAHAGLAA